METKRILSHYKFSRNEAKKAATTIDLRDGKTMRRDERKNIKNKFSQQVKNSFRKK
jgi:hypothetical protein